ncbi:MAG: NAD-dependent epimerase/dehydratase family protein, partial [Verrucomicrobia bacterium]
MGKAYEAVTEAVNARAAAENARLAKAAGVKHFVFASSCSVYGAAGDQPRTEESELNPLTAYARSKIAAEKALEPLAGPDFTVTCLRFATACGFSPRLRLDLVLNDFVASALATGKIEILSDGTPWRPLIEVRDMARAIHWAGTRDNSAGDFLVVNAGSNQWNYRVVELAEAVKAQLGDVEVSINKNASPDKRSYRVDFSKFARLAPDFQPQIDLAAAVRELVKGLSAVHFADANFRDSWLIRLKVLNRLRETGRLDDDLRWRTPAAPAPATGR